MKYNFQYLASVHTVIVQIVCSVIDFRDEVDGVNKFLKGLQNDFYVGNFVTLSYIYAQCTHWFKMCIKPAY